jgi:hypothetical protein
MATALVWVMVRGGQWTRIFQGPSFHVSMVQILEFQTFTAAQGSFVVAHTVQRYSAAAPFYYSISGTSIAAPQSTYPVPSSSIEFLPAGTFSPWTEIWLFTDRSCRAHVLV